MISLVLAMTMIAPVTASERQQPLPVLVLVVSEGCSACRQVEPHAHLLARKGLLRVLDYEQYPDWCRNQGIRAVPHLIVWQQRGDRRLRADFIGSENILEYARRP